MCSGETNMTRRRRLFPSIPRLLTVLILTACLAGCLQPRAAEGLQLATWNLEHLAAADGAGCRPRSASDYSALAAVARELAADIVALQEVESAAAVARVFDPAVYDIVISDRAITPSGRCRGGSNRLTAQRTGFAVHRGRLRALGLRYRVPEAFAEIGLDRRRWGTRLLIEPVHPSGPATVLELMSLHLKSGCAWGALGDDDRVRDVRRAQCLILRRQRGVLEEWIDARATADVPFVLVGDFNRQLDQPGDDFWRAIDDGRVCDWQPDDVLGRRCIDGTQRRDADADLVLAGAGRPFPFAPNPRYPYAIDHFVLGGPAADWLVPGSYRALDYEREPHPSDHHPLRITLRLPWSLQQ
jgi:endonuclease/exonuclease/phosphatase family metal-dependent hydrolase